MARAGYPKKEKIIGRERGGGGERLFKRALGLLDRLQAGVALERARQRNRSIVADVVLGETARSWLLRSGKRWANEPQQKELGVRKSGWPKESV